MRLFLSILSGLLMGLALPMQWGHWVPPNLGFLAWVALVPLMLAVQGLRPWKAYWVAFVGMLVGHTFIVYWIYTALNTYGHLSHLASVFVLSLALISMALITAAAPAFVCLIERRRGPTWWAWPLAWAAVEYLHNFVPVGGFTFCNLIHSQYKYPLLFQVVNLVGPYWFLAVMVLVNVLVAKVIVERRYWPSIAAIGVMILLGTYGLISIAANRHAPAPWFRVGLVQGNIPQEEKWDAAKAVQNFETYRRASQELFAGHPDLIIWPEASYPWALDLRATQLPRHHLLPPVPILMGAITRGGDRHHNSAVLMDETGRVADVVHKYHLVPYGEYVPYKKYLKFLEDLTSVAGDMDPGPAIRPLNMNGLPMGVLVCYEDTFPEIARSLVAQGSVLLVNITNDAWYGRSPAATQHLAASVFRAAENGRYLVRATNTGVSAVIGPDGRVWMQSPLYESALINTQTRLFTHRTLYNRYGRWTDPGIVILLALAVGYAAIRPPPEKLF